MKKFNKAFITVFTDGNHHKAILPSGEVIPHPVESITVDDVNASIARFSFVCNVVTTKEEALRKYKEE